MSDPELGPELSAEQEARLRRLLSEARHGDPMPVDVAARLDGVLARLAEEGTVPAVEEPPPASVGDLTARRRRRVGMLLAAAAAVVVAGVGIGRVIGVQQHEVPQSAASSDDAAADRSAAASLGASESSPAPLDSGAPMTTEVLPGATTQPGLRARPSRVPVVSAERFGHDVARVRARLTRLATTAPFAGTEVMCDDAHWGPGDLVAVRYRGGPAVLAFRPASGSTQVADLLQCGSGDVLRSTSVPLR